MSEYKYSVGPISVCHCGNAGPNGCCANSNNFFTTTQNDPSLLKIECDPTEHDFVAVGEYRALCRKCGQRIFL